MFYTTTDIIVNKKIGWRKILVRYKASFFYKESWIYSANWKLCPDKNIVTMIEFIQIINGYFKLKFINPTWQ